MGLEPREMKTGMWTWGEQKRPSSSFQMGKSSGTTTLEADLLDVPTVSDSEELSNGLLLLHKWGQQAQEPTVHINCF